MVVGQFTHLSEEARGSNNKLVRRYLERFSKNFTSGTIERRDVSPLKHVSNLKYQEISIVGPKCPNKEIWAQGTKFQKISVFLLL